MRTKYTAHNSDDITRDNGVMLSYLNDTYCCFEEIETRQSAPGLVYSKWV